MVFAEKTMTPARMGRGLSGGGTPDFGHSDFGVVGPKTRGFLHSGIPKRFIPTTQFPVAPARLRSFAFFFFLRVVIVVTVPGQNPTPSRAYGT